MANTVQLTIKPRTFDNQLIRDVPTRITLRPKDSQPVKTFNTRFLQGRETLEVPTEPKGIYEVTLVPKRYQQRSFFVRIWPGEPVTEEVLCPREYTKWNARFERWDQLGNDYSALTKLLEKSPRVWFRNTKNNRMSKLGLFTEANYETDDNPTRKAKAGMLNLFAKMVDLGFTDPDGKAWWRSVRELLVIQHDRILALITPEAAAAVEHLAKPTSFTPTYDSASPALHVANMEAGVRALELGETPKRGAMSSVKTHEAIGVLQLTVAPVTLASGEVLHLLDADIDENGKLLKHFGNLISHQFTGGTRPYEVYEILNRTLAKPRLAYHLV